MSSPLKNTNAPHQVEVSSTGPDTGSHDRGGVLAVAVEQGVAELSSAILLRGTALRLFEEHGPALSQELTERELTTPGAESDERVRRDAASFLASLRSHGLLAESGRVEYASVRTEVPTSRSARDFANDASGEPPGGVNPVELEAADVERLAREILRRGFRLRYQALGRSMRPSIPHGSTIEVEACSFAAVRLGDVALYSVGETRLVAHRVVGRRDAKLVMRGDTCARVDEVSEPDYLGRVRAIVAPNGNAVLVSSGMRRVLGLVGGQAWRVASAGARALVIGPLRSSLDNPFFVRRALWGGLRIASGVLLRLERLGRVARRPLDVARSALLSGKEKDDRRRELYERRTVQSFTSLDENVDAGLTLIEEAIFARHPSAVGAVDVPGAPGRALVLGCGPGRECMALAEMGFDVTGTDREEGMLERARALASERDLHIHYEIGEAMLPDVEADAFDTVVVFSGLFNMVLPRANRVRMLAAARGQLRPGGRVLLTFLSAYVDAGAPPPSASRGFWSAVNPEHQLGDLFLLNEAVHVFPRAQDLVGEATEARLEVEELYRDQRAYDRDNGKVRGYVVLRRPAK